MSRRNPEGKIQDAIRKYLDNIRDSFFVKPTITNKRGCPDIIGDILGTSVYIEVKKDERGRPSKLQQYYLDKATERGAIAFCTHGAGHCRSLLEYHCKEKGIQLRYIS